MLMDLSIALFLLVGVNFLLALGRMQKRVWLGMTLRISAFLLLIPAIGFGIRALGGN